MNQIRNSTRNTITLPLANPVKCFKKSHASCILSKAWQTLSTITVNSLTVDLEKQKRYCLSDRRSCKVKTLNQFEIAFNNLPKRSRRSIVKNRNYRREFPTSWKVRNSIVSHRIGAHFLRQLQEYHQIHLIYRNQV